MEAIKIKGRRWFNGNTYHSVSIDLPDGRTGYVGVTYGYGYHYEQTAAEWLEKNAGLSPREKHENGGAESLRLWLERLGYVLESSVMDVKRKRDL